MQAMLALLPESYRVVIVLRYWHDFSYEEMAQMLGTSESAVKSRLHRAREMLAGHLAKRRAAAAGECPGKEEPLSCVALSCRSG